MNIEPNMALKLYEAHEKCKPDEKVICRSGNVIEIVKKTWWDKAQDRIFRRSNVSNHNGHKQNNMQGEGTFNTGDDSTPHSNRSNSR